MIRSLDRSTPSAVSPFAPVGGPDVGVTADGPSPPAAINAPEKKHRNGVCGGGGRCAAGRAAGRTGGQEAGSYTTIAVSWWRAVGCDWHQLAQHCAERQPPTRPLPLPPPPPFTSAERDDIALAMQRECEKGHALTPGAAMQSIPQQVFYTAPDDSGAMLLNITHKGSSSRWPSDMGFAFYNHDARDRSTDLLDRFLQAEANVSGFAEAYYALKPFAFRADVWRCAIFWACSGTYLDHKYGLMAGLQAFRPTPWQRWHTPPDSAKYPQALQCSFASWKKGLDGVRQCVYHGHAEASRSTRGPAPLHPEHRIQKLPIRCVRHRHHGTRGHVSRYPCRTQVEPSHVRNVPT